jgi:phenylacetate-CoA ligase
MTVTRESPGASDVDVYARFAASLARSERMPRAGLDAHRDQLLARLASFAYANSPFYAERLKPLFRNGGEPDLAAWREIPILRRSDLENEIDRINPRELPSELGEIIERRTSGTTGSKPLSFRTCLLVRVADACMMQRLYRWWGFDTSKPMASVRHLRAKGCKYPEGKTEPQWSYPGPAAPHHMLDLDTTIGNIIEWLARRQPKYLLTFPSIAQRLAAHPDAASVAALGLQGMVTISEITGDDTRAAVREKFGCEIAQIYGCAEVGAIGLQSPVNGELLLCEENVFAEVLDDRNEPVASGQTGRVILTGLYNYATPFIRYEIGDYVTLADGADSDGFTLSRLLRVEGRRRNALITRDGRRIWQSAIPGAIVMRRVSTTEFQIRQPDATTIELVYVPNGDALSDSAGLAADFGELLGHPITIVLTKVESVPRTLGGKHERIVSTIAR